MPRMHPFYYYRSKSDAPLGVFERRDESAMSEVLGALAELGYRRGEPILNFPPPDRKARPPGQDLLEVDLSFVEQDDLIVQLTRPPLDDLDAGNRKLVWPGFTTLEWTFFGIHRRWFKTLSRPEVFLQHDLHHLLEPPFHTRRHMFFREATGAAYLQLQAGGGAAPVRTRKKTERRSAAFLLYVPHAWDGGPGYLCAWGMDGTCTEVWAYRLARDYAYLLKEPCFVIAELTNNGIPDRPTDMRWAKDKWGIEIILRTQPFDLGPEPRANVEGSGKSGASHDLGAC